MCFYKLNVVILRLKTSRRQLTTACKQICFQFVRTGIYIHFNLKLLFNLLKLYYLDFHY